MLRALVVTKLFFLISAMVDLKEEMKRRMAEAKAKTAGNLAKVGAHSCGFVLMSGRGIVCCVGAVV